VTLIEDELALGKVGHLTARYSDFAYLHFRRLGFGLWEVFVLGSYGLFAHNLGRTTQVTQSTIVREQHRHSLTDLFSRFHNHVVKLLIL